ncbi:FAD-linked oxidase [Saccharothrix sp. CB00851]|nr:FAD-linked oxidase [Saccharothrix sp. CB00851]
MVITRADRRYRDLIRGHNPRFVGDPDAVHVVDSTAQVVEVVQKAVTERKRLTIRSGGHCAEDFVFGPEVQVVLDLSEMNRVYFDAARRAITVEPGAVMKDIYELLYKAWGITIPAGIFHSVGAGGLFAGGGHGWLSRTHGMAVDHLYAVEVVVVDAKGRARAVVATREDDDPHRDLWWAHTGGGGGNFGVVTRYWFRSPGASGKDPRAVLPQPPAEVLFSTVVFQWSGMTREKFTRLLKNFGAFCEKHKDPASPYLGVTGNLWLPHRSNGQLGVTTQVDGSRPDAERLLDAYLAQVLDGAEPDLRVPTLRMPWLESVRHHSGTTDSNQNDPTVRGDYKSAMMRGNLPNDQIEAIHRFLTSADIDNPAISLSFIGFGGRTNAVAPGATAFPHRDCSMNVLWTAVWRDPAEDAKYIAWNREFYAAVYAQTGGVPVPNAVTGGCYVNDPDTDVADPRLNRSGVPWHELYYNDNYPRLRQVKAKWDPQNFFRHALSVELP